MTAYYFMQLNLKRELRFRYCSFSNKIYFKFEEVVFTNKIEII